jgi:2-C-methyl-D-erythritol 4-phosphate cytidylyltransferase
MGSSIPKQYLPLGDSLVIEHTLERLLAHPSIRGVLVAISPGDGWWESTRFCSSLRVRQVSGGAKRCHSVLNALKQLTQLAAPDDWVLVHDAARPCLSGSDIDRLVGELSGHPVGGLLAVPLHDTVKRADASGQVVETLPREQLWRAFTPQMFRLEALRMALEQALEQGFEVTDEARAMELAGFSPLLVEGRGDNIKITRPEDLALAAFYLEQQKKEL